jgi:hypothetical protein
MALLVVAMAACSGDPVGPVITVEVELPDGSDPLAGREIERVVVRTRVGDGAVEERTDDDPADGFDLRFPLADLGTTVRATVEIVAADGERLLGAPPPFRPGETSGALRVIVLPASTCAVVDGAYDVAFRARPGLAVLGSFAFVAGGVEATGDPSARAEFVDLLAWGGGAFEPGLVIDGTDREVGAARAVHLGGSLALLLPDDPAIAPIAFDISRPDDRAAPIELHAGAGAGSAVLALGPIDDGGGTRSITGGGAVIVGGRDGAGGPLREVTWVAADGAIARTRLLVPRANPALHEIDGRVLVAGGTDAAAPTPAIEIIARDVGEGTEALDVLDPPTHIGAALFPEPGGTALLLVGGTDLAGMALTSTTLLTGCPACAAAGGPDLPESADALLVPLAHLGGMAISESGPSRVVTWSSGAPVLEPLGPLAASRDGARAAALPSGQVLVVGDGPLEVCVPATLALP